MIYAVLIKSPGKSRIQAVLDVKIDPGNGDQYLLNQAESVLAVLTGDSGGSLRAAIVDRHGPYEKVHRQPIGKGDGKQVSKKERVSGRRKKVVSH